MDWPVGLRQRDLSAAGIRTRCYLSEPREQVPWLLLLHGLGEAAVVWFRNVGHLTTHFNLVVPDLPGHGRSSKSLDGYSLEMGVRWLSALLDALGVRQASLVGNSLGGLVAAAFARRRPQRVDALVLEDSAGLGREVAGFLRLMALPAVGELLAWSTVANLRRLMRTLFWDPSRVPSELLHLLHQERRQSGNKAAMLRILRTGVAFWGMRPSVMALPWLREIGAPTLVVWGQEDRIFPVAHAYRAVQALPRGSLQVLAQCGHWPHLERAEEFNALVLEFLQQPKGERGTSQGGTGVLV